MTEKTFNAVLKMDEQNTGFTPAAHNLSAEKAVAKVNELKGNGIQAQILLQASHHKGRSFKSCELCKTAAQNLSQAATSGATEEEHEEDAENQ
jgi:hypothetical protein